MEGVGGIGSGAGRCGMRFTVGWDRVGWEVAKTSVRGIPGAFVMST